METLTKTQAISQERIGFKAVKKQTQARGTAQEIRDTPPIKSYEDEHLEVSNKILVLETEQSRHLETLNIDKYTEVDRKLSPLRLKLERIEAFMSRSDKSVVAREITSRKIFKCQSHVSTSFKTTVGNQLR